MKNNILVILAKRENIPVAASLNFLSEDTLYGRYWGCNEHIPFLHFEVCYYKAIEIAIDLKLKRVEAGAQGPHKIQRGYLPTPMYSAHYIRDSNLRNAISDYLKMERTAVEKEIKIIFKDHSPYKN